MAGSDYDVVVIGSGVGGLTGAALLAKQGMKVLVLEQSNRIGGCCSNYDHDGFKPDVGAIFVIAREMYDPLFELLELRLEDHLDFRLLDPVYDAVLGDGSRHLLPRDLEAMGEVVRSISPQDVDGYQRWCRDMGKSFKAYQAAMKATPRDLESVLSLERLVRMGAGVDQLAAIPTLLKHVTTNLEKMVNGYFSNDQLRILFGWENLYAALPASRCLGAFSMITYFGRMGYYYPKGGMIAIPQALDRIMQSFGAEIRYGAPVAKILVRNGRVHGVRLADGEEIPAKTVLSNIHSRTTYLDLVGEDNLPRSVVKAVHHQPCSIPAPTFYLGLSEKLDSVRSHMSVIMPDKICFDRIWTNYYDRGLLYRPEDGGFLVTCASHDDPDLAPEGKQVLSVIYVAPYKLQYYDWDQVGEEWAWSCVDVLEKRAFPGLRSKVEWMDSVTPLELERRLRLPEGAFFGLEMTATNMGPFRPNWRSHSVKGLYLAGQCTNPGGGVPLVMLSGIHASSALVKDWRKL
jgi:phytoene desaturase